jgi:hypothetical protein
MEESFGTIAHGEEYLSAYPMLVYCICMREKIKKKQRADRTKGEFIYNKKGIEKSALFILNYKSL